MAQYQYCAFSNDDESRILATAFCESDKDFERALKSGFGIQEIKMTIETENPESEYACPGLGVLFNKYRSNDAVRFNGNNTLLLSGSTKIVFERIKGATTTLHLHVHGRRVRSFENAAQVHDCLFS